LPKPPTQHSKRENEAADPPPTTAVRIVTRAESHVRQD
jgi:hypothetical protein